MNPLGCYYFHVFYPSKLLLNKKSIYHLILDGIDFTVLVVDHGRSLIVNDYNNKIIEAEGISNYQAENRDITIGKGALSMVIDDEPQFLGYVIDVSKHRFKELYYKDFTEVIFHFEAKRNDKNIDIALKAMNHFINAYRIVSNDVLTLTIDKITYFARVYKEFFHEYSDEELKMTADQRQKVNRSLHLGVKQVILPFWNTQGRTFETNPARNTKDLADFLSRQKKQEPVADSF
jgi:hypothetical protein